VNARMAEMLSYTTREMFGARAFESWTRTGGAIA
jgi:hypothetical protein